MRVTLFLWRAQARAGQLASPPRVPRSRGHTRRCRTSGCFGTLAVIRPLAPVACPRLRSSRCRCSVCVQQAVLGTPWPPGSSQVNPGPQGGERGALQDPSTAGPRAGLPTTGDGSVFAETRLDQRDPGPGQRHSGEVTARGGDRSGPGAAIWNTWLPRAPSAAVGQQEGGETGRRQWGPPGPGLGESQIALTHPIGQNSAIWPSLAAQDAGKCSP